MTRAAVENAAVGPSPTINRAVVMKKKEAMVEDIGLLQNTIVRAPFKLLPSVFSKEFRSYLWKLLKAKGTGLYSYVSPQQCDMTARGKQDSVASEFMLTSLAGDRCIVDT